MASTLAAVGPGATRSLESRTSEPTHRRNAPGPLGRRRGWGVIGPVSPTAVGWPKASLAVDRSQSGDFFASSRLPDGHPGRSEGPGGKCPRRHTEMGAAALPGAACSFNI